MSNIYARSTFYRKKVIESQTFLLEVGLSRIVGAFANIEADAEARVEQAYERLGQRPGTGAECMGDVAEDALGEGIHYYDLVDKLRRNAILSIAILMYHEWETSLGEWLSALQQGGKIEPKAKLHEMSFPRRYDLMEKLGVASRESAYYGTLDELRLVVNTQKHGEGPSLDTLFVRRPEFFPGGGGTPQKDPNLLNIGPEDLKRYSDSIVDFWRELPLCE